MRYLWLPALEVLALAYGSSIWICHAADAGPSFTPAVFEAGNPARLHLFPTDGPEEGIDLPTFGMNNMHGIAFSLDGTSLYVQNNVSLFGSIGINKIEFQPLRVSKMPGSVGIGAVGCFTVSQSSGRITVTRGRSIEEIDPVSATKHILPPGSIAVCGGGGGSLLSPDGTLAMTLGKKQLSLTTIKTGTAMPIKGTNKDTLCAWSPDSKWLACTTDRKILLIDPANPGKPTSHGSPGNGPISPVKWSPDSRYLLLRQSGHSCAYPDASSLAIVDVKTGERKEVKSSICTISVGTLGWLDRSLVH